MTHIDEPKSDPIAHLLAKDALLQEKKWEKGTVVQSLNEKRDAATVRIFQEYAEKFSELSPKVELTYTQEEGSGNYTIHLSRNGKTESIKVPESGDGFKFASVADMLQILHAGIESKWNIFVNKKTDLFTQWARALLWNDEQRKTLPYDIIIDNRIVFSARKEENDFKHTLWRRLETVSKSL